MSALSKSRVTRLGQLLLLVYLPLSHPNSQIKQAFISGLSGVDVMITILGDFCQFSAKKMAFFSKTNVVIFFCKN
jgi:hypothetical protein